MNLSKAMIDLITEARRRAPSEDKPSIKLANPNILSELHTLYHNSQDTVLKAIIKEAFSLAGDPWPAKLLKEEPSEQPDIKYVTRVYRGQTQLLEVKQDDAVGGPNPTTKPKRIYRGQVVA